MNANIDPYTPVRAVLVHIQSRYDSLEPCRPFELFCKAEASWYRDPRRDTPDIDPWFATCKFRGMELELYQALVRHVASAVSCSMEALTPEAKPLLNLLLQAMHHCRMFDMKKALLDEATAARRAARVKGGKLRHAANNPARDETARLLLVKRPVSGWPDAITAARAIEEDLKTFILQKRLGIVAGDHLIRTIVRWIRTVPQVSAAFAAETS